MIGFKFDVDIGLFCISYFLDALLFRKLLPLMIEKIIDNP